MTDLLLALGLLGVVVAVGIVVPVVAVRWRLRRRNRVHPKVASPAPLSWLVSPTTPARLHRRLQATVRVASVHRPRRAPDDVALRAIELDRLLVLASRRPHGQRGPALRELQAEVDELDRLALAVNRPFDTLALGDPKERLTALAEAHAELDAVDHTIA